MAEINSYKSFSKNPKKWLFDTNFSAKMNIFNFFDQMFIIINPNHSFENGIIFFNVNRTYSNIF